MESIIEKNRLNKILFYPGDNAETLELKRNYFIFSAVVIPPVIGLTALTIFLDVPVLELYGWFLLTYFIMSQILFLILKRYVETFYYLSSTVVMLFTFFIVMRQGGIVYSGGILYSSLAFAVFAFVFNKLRMAVFTSLLYIAGILTLTFIQPRLVPAPEMMKGNINLIFTSLNATWISIYILAVIFYVFDRRAKEEKSKTKKLKEIDDLKTRLFTNITHEFRTPLTIILGASSPQERFSWSSLPNEGKGGKMELIRNNANKLLRLVNQMLNLSRLESGTMKTTYVQMDMISFLGYLTESCRSMAEKKGVKLHFLKGQNQLFMDLDPDKMEDIILNLIFNAIKFTPTGGDVYISTDVFNKDYSYPQLIIRVRDTGIGISEKNLNLIFERFFQVEENNVPIQEGSGIGLTIVREYIKLLGGSIEVTSKINEGTEFVIKLPVTRNAEKAEIKNLIS